AAWLRDREAHRAPVAWRHLVLRGLTLSHALPARTARPDRRAVGRETRPAPPPLLSPHAGGPARPRGPAHSLAALHSRYRPGGGTGARMTDIEWKRLVRERFDADPTDPARDEELIEELAQHVGLRYAELIGAG